MTEINDTPLIRVMIVDDHQVIRQGLAMFLKAFPDLEFVGEAANGQEAIDLCGKMRPDVILMDMKMPLIDGVTAIRSIRQEHPEINIIALTSFTDDKQLVQAALEAGAIGYLFKDISINDLAMSIRTAHSGTPVLSVEATRMLIQSKTRRTATDFNLSVRELEVLELVVQGLNNTQIAERLTISRSTIKFHVSSILGKLGATSRTEAASIAHQYKLVT